MKKGSLTVFLSLSLTILISFSLFVTEIAIGNSQRIRFETVTDMAMDSVMGEYSVALKERYGLLYVDTSYLEGAAEAVRVTDRFRVYFDANTTKVSEKKHAPWGRLLLQEAVLSSFETAAAQGGKSMQNQMIRYMERHPENGTEMRRKKRFLLFPCRSHPMPWKHSVQSWNRLPVWSFLYWKRKTEPKKRLHLEIRRTGCMDSLEVMLSFCVMWICPG